MSSDERDGGDSPAFERTLTATGDTAARQPAASPATDDTWLGGLGDVKSTRLDFDELREVDPANYVLGDELARGGMGRILAMRDRRLGRLVAVKELLNPSRQLLGRFQREALITSRLQHPAIVSVYEAGRWPTGEPFFAMKLVDGLSLKQVIARTRTLDERIALLPNVITIVDALAYAHEQGIIHRDLKPANVLIGDFGETVVIDWGLAKRLDDDQEALEGAPLAGPGTEATMAGAVIGTPAYMAPEQARGEPATERTDVYALGAILYTTLAGEAPYVAPTAAALLEKVVAAPPLPLTEVAPGVPDDLQTIVAKAMARDPADRYPSAVELARDLTRFQTGQLVRAHDYGLGALLVRWLRRHRAAVAVALAAALVLAAVGGISLNRVVTERDRAQAARARAEAAEVTSTARADEVVLAHARSLIDDKPLEGLSRLRKLSARTSVWPAARMIAARAHVHGLPRTLAIPIDEIQSFDVSPDGKQVALIAENPDQNRSWFLLDLASARLRLVGSHSARVHSVEFSRDGKLVATASRDNTVRIWQVATGTFRELRGHKGWVFAASFSSDGRYLVSVGFDGARRWRLDTGTSELLAERGSKVFVAPAADLAVQVDQATPTVMQLRELNAGTRHALPAQAGRIIAVRFAPGGRRFATAGGDGSVRVWEVATRASRLLGRHDEEATHLIWSEDGKQLVTSGKDRTVRVWNLATGKHWAFRDHTARVYGVRLSADGRRLVSVGADDTFRLVDLATRTGRVLRGADAHPRFSASGEQVFSLSKGKQLQVWDVTAADHRVLSGKLPMRSVSFDLSGKRLLGVGAGWSLHLWDLGSGAVRLLRGHKSPVYTAVISPAGHAASLSVSKRVRLWDLDRGTSVELPGRGSVQLCFSGDGEQLAAPGDDHTVKLWSVRTAELRSLRGHQGWVARVAFSPTRAELASVGARGMVWLWDTTTGQGKLLGQHNGPARTVSFDPSGERLATGGEDGVVRVWSRTGQMRELGKHARWVMQLAFSPDGRYLASAGERELRVWELRSAQQRVWRSPDRSIHTLTFSPDGRTIATASGRNLRLWNVATGESRPLTGHTKLVWDLAWAPDGRALASASEDGTVRLWSDSLPHDPVALRDWLERVVQPDGSNR